MFINLNASRGSESCFKFGKLFFFFFNDKFSLMFQVLKYIQLTSFFFWAVKPIHLQNINSIHSVYSCFERGYREESVNDKNESSTALVMNNYQYNSKVNDF